jgi:hypothetical protein
MRRHVVRPWSYDDLAKLAALAREVPVREIAVALERSPSAVTSKARELRLSLKVKSDKLAIFRKTPS